MTHPLHHLAAPATQPSSRLKRRFEPEDENDTGPQRPSPGARDESMDRSPTPERPKRGVPKRARTSPATNILGSKDVKENKSADSDNDVDVGVLLASLPSQSLLPILTSLISSQPSLKSHVLSLIPRPSLDTALQALQQSAKKLRDAYPYSNLPQPTPPSSSFGFGFGSASTSRSPTFGASSSNGGMRQEYIVSRLTPHINEFTSACLSYLPYFSLLPSSSPARPTPSSPTHGPQRDKLHPTETFTFLSSLTGHILSQPPLTQASLVPALLPRLLDEWKAWVDHVSEVVNKQGGMFGGETVRGWERALDEFAEAKDHGLEAFREVRDRWVAQVGWLVGRQHHRMMDL
ncbi:uncharacterized protein STEHIDRAFT_46102 [Stereum hirsutum FP-91666 SS1]|uniref:uncharacterized protein n=1 Tax=Stereum hirsutum (strain FP-91666) TaxID=721885 RepID=UPI000440C16E|nr:uncharacterized protein STEHIDRAFT_46102 [Stereum hirsutum FP-91666 SS1]EIM92603.1 hypothetical protein STEHIDRAFT_46102 [Stereum hirsutum FP-91666 SS1]